MQNQSLNVTLFFRIGITHMHIYCKSIVLNPKNPITPTPQPIIIQTCKTHKGDIPMQHHKNQKKCPKSHQIKKAKRTREKK